jgi:very-short-patch-repair endonuclease
MKKLKHGSLEYRRKMSLLKVGHLISKNTREKISRSLLGHRVTRRTKLKISKSKRGIKQSLQTTQKRSKSLMGHVVTEKTKLKISKSHFGMKGVSPSLETRKRLSEANQGRIVSSRTREKLRLATLKKLDKFRSKYGKLFINRSEKEIDCIDNYLQDICPYEIDVGFRIVGYMVDGYVHELNLVIEFDEKYHENFKQKIEDKERQRNIYKSLKCKFFRITERQWIRNKEKIIDKFQKLIARESIKLL